MNVTVFIEGQRLDLHEDENIRITQGVKNVKDISKLFADFSKSFSVPASPNNNRIFKHYYNADIDGGFDARIRKKCVVDVGTLDFKRGKVQLNSVSIKNGRPSNYNITFFGDVIKVKDLLGDDKLFQLDWLDNFTHDYSDTNVKTGLTTGLDFTVDGTLYSKAIIYPLASYKRQFLYNSNTGDTTSTETLVNIAYHASRSDGVDFTELKPAINLPIILKAINVKYGLNFTGAFFESKQFTKLYMNLNNKTEKLSNGYLLLENITGNQPFIDNTNDRYRYSATITPKAGFTAIPYKVRLTVLGTVVYESQNFVTGTNTFHGAAVQYEGDYDVKAEIITQADFEFNATTQLRYTYNSFNQTIVFANTYNDQVIDLDVNVNNEIPNIKIYDFLTSLFKIGNCVIVPDGDDLSVQDLINWYAEGNIYDITPYIDTESQKVRKGKIFNRIDFKYEKSDQILADEFFRNNNISYGNIEQRLYEDEAQTIPINGEKLEVKLIFENPVFERLFDNDTGDLTSIMYCPYISRDLKSIEGKPFLFYAPSVSVASNSIGYKNLVSYEQINSSVIMPSHSIQVDQDSFNINFNAEINEYTYQVFTDTIYKRYYEDYIADTFSIKRRIFDFEGILPNRLLNVLKLNDRLIIEDCRYIINTIDSNLTTRKDNLELINDIYSMPLANDILNNSVLNLTYQEFGSVAFDDSVIYTGIVGGKILKIDDGHGVGWLTVNDTLTDKKVYTLDFSIDANNTGSDRSVQIKIDDSINNPVLTIIQYG